MNATHERRLARRSEVREIVHRSDATIYRWERAGLLTPIYIRGFPHYDLDEVRRLVAHGDGSAPRAPGVRGGAA